MKRRSGDAPAVQVPFVRGFVPPTAEECVRAVGSPPDSDWLLDPCLFDPLARPVSDEDWLAQYREERQDVRRFRQDNPWFGRVKNRGGTYVKCKGKNVGTFILSNKSRISLDMDQFLATVAENSPTI